MVFWVLGPSARAAYLRVARDSGVLLACLGARDRVAARDAGRGEHERDHHAAELQRRFGSGSGSDDAHEREQSMGTYSGAACSDKSCSSGLRASTALGKE
mgnify:CR=1 FL=1